MVWCLALRTAEKLKLESQPRQLGKRRKKHTKRGVYGEGMHEYSLPDSSVPGQVPTVVRA